MAFIHGKGTVVKVATFDLSAYTNNSEITRGADKEDITCYGADDYVYQGGLKSGTFVMGGTYEGGTSGPRAKLLGLIGTVVAVIRQPEGTGSGKAQDSFSALVEKYVETNPVAGMITWSCDFTISGAVTTTAQSA